MWKLRDGGQIMFGLKTLFKKETGENEMSNDTLSPTVLVTCSKCGQVNNVERSKLADKPVCGSCKESLVLLDAPVKVTTSTFKQEVEDWKGYVLVDFWATWCPPCKMIAPVLESISKEKTGELKIAKVDVDHEPQLSRRFSISSIPTLMLFKDGKEVAQIAGAMPKAKLLEWIERSK